ncbi:hypothetical protein BJX96DRAFT_4347 [Aspergillus floccosus]
MALLQGRNISNDSDSSDDDIWEVTVKHAWDQLFIHDETFLLGSRKCSVDLTTLHPEPVQIVRLWQTYLDHVNPLLKLTHTPGLQGRIIDAAASNAAQIDATTEALMFSIYCISILSLTTKDCQTIFSSSKEDLLRAYQFGCEQALLNSGVSRTTNRECLTALFLYLLSFGNSADPRSLSSMFGLAIRIAQRMGIDSETANAKCTILEAEMRRRLWWSLVLFDSRITELGGIKSSTLAPTWDCKLPLNVNDSDLWAEMNQAPNIQPKVTESLFAVVRCELGEYLRHAEFYLDFTMPALKALAKGHEPSTGGLDALERMLNERYLQFCDVGNPLHFMTSCVTRGTLARYRLMEHYARRTQSSAEQADADTDLALSYALSMLRSDTEIRTSPLTKCFVWLTQFYFPMLAYMHIMQYLKRRPVGETAEAAWDALADSFDARFDVLPSGNPLFDILLKMITPAWEARQKACQETDQSLPIPRIVSRIHSEMPLPNSNPKWNATSNTLTPTASDDNTLPTPISSGFFPIGESGDATAEQGLSGSLGIPELFSFDFDGDEINHSGMDFSWGASYPW